MRDRTYLTSIQVSKEQKEIIDKAYDKYNEPVSRGEFLQILCELFLQSQ